MNADPTALQVLVLSVHQDLGEGFVGAVCGEGMSVELGGHRLRFDVLSGDPRLNAAWDDTITAASGLVLLTRFLDIISLDKVRAIYRRLPGGATSAMAVVSLREPNETDFKMSCPVCGQKLWVRDSDAGKRGRCPNCKKAFELPDQLAHIRAQLALPDSIQVVRVVQGNKDSATQAIKQLLPHMTGGLVESGDEAVDQNVLKQSTIRVQINPEDV
jgi:predicted RNA-binding Zn-ribbon protein involved in translation (DUF1610 family)